MQPCGSFIRRGMVMYPKLAPTSYTQSPEPEIAKKHFGFEFWLTVGLFLFLIAQWGFLRAGQAARDAGRHLLTGPRSRALDALRVCSRCAALGLPRSA